MKSKHLIMPLLFVFAGSIVKGQSISEDFFPLSVGNIWSYKYQTTEWDMSDVYRYDNGTATYTILSVIADKDSIVWTFMEKRNIEHSIHYYFSGPDTSYSIQDSTIFQIIEYSINNHRLVRMGNTIELWKSVFLFPNELTDTLGFYRYQPNSMLDTLVFEQLDPVLSSYKINSIFKRLTGITSTKYSSTNVIGYSASTDHFLLSSFLTSVQTNKHISHPDDFILGQNFPNPFNPITTLTINLPVQLFGSLQIFNLIGQHVATIKEGIFSAGMSTVTWDASAFPSGSYFCRLIATGESGKKYTKVIKMALVR